MSVLKEKDNEIMNDDYYNRYINEMNKIYQEDKIRANRMAKRRLIELGYIKENRKNSANSLNLEFDKKTKIIIGICILFFLVSFLAPDPISIPIYLFGLVFFLAGLFIGLYIPYFGLIFLLTHGGTGFFLMLSTLIASNPNQSSIGIDFANNPVFSDGGIPSNIKLYFYLIIVILIVAVVFTIIHNVSEKVKSDKKNTIIILILYLIVVVLVTLSTRFFPVLRL